MRLSNVAQQTTQMSRTEKGINEHTRRGGIMESLSPSPAAPFLTPPAALGGNRLTPSSTLDSTRSIEAKTARLAAARGARQDATPAWCRCQHPPRACAQPLARALPSAPRVACPAEPCRAAARPRRSVSVSAGHSAAAARSTAATYGAFDGEHHSSGAPAEAARVAGRADRAARGERAPGCACGGPFGVRSARQD